VTAASGDIGARRARLAAAERDLVRLEAQYDLLMSHFKFDDAKELRSRIEVQERECRTLAAGLPEPETPSPSPFTVARRSRRRRRR
jgi:hypothetical protein